MKIVNPDYVMTADTMITIPNRNCIFSVRRVKWRQSIFIVKRLVRHKNDVTRIWKNAVIDNREQIIHGDSLFFII